MEITAIKLIINDRMHNITQDVSWHIFLNDDEKIKWLNDLYEEEVYNNTQISSILCDPIYEIREYNLEELAKLPISEFGKMTLKDLIFIFNIINNK